MATSCTPRLIDALLATFHATFDPLKVPVLDGPEPTDENPGQFIAVGYDGDPTTADDQAAAFTQEWAALGQLARHEDIEVVCCVCVLSADNVKAARDATYALFSQVELDLRATPWQGAGVQWAHVTAGTYHPVATESGMGGRLAFTISARCRI